ncbi:neprosin family prolyl endopeptidase [Actinoplanes sp. NPDC048967]|uniref:neprosin family prolyl endopeptidase n=1 Tax=Actinoplanes sp. NPDC048967 TaxID=3155269 RepID=UPI0033D114AC
MSNSRRGLLAAGLAVAVVGTMGTVWTLNASAEETTEAEAPAAAVAPATTETAPEPAETAPEAAPVTAETAPATTEAAPEAPAAGEAILTPPKLLPWGAKPKRLKQAKAGASSKAVAAAGADAAPADTSGAVTPTREYAPKGGQGPNGAFLKSARTTVVPPTPPTVGTVKAAAAADRVVNFHYAVGAQTGETDGTWANLTIEKPKLVDGDYHTLAELAVRSADSKQTVEVGWTVDRSVNGDDDPHLFVFYWKDGVARCYNACEWTQIHKTVKPGDTLPVGTSKRFGIMHDGNAWWIAYNSEYIGYFHDKNWEGRFTRAGLAQWFGEVASPSLTPCTQMGNGKPASDGDAARIGSISMTKGPTVGFDLDMRPKYKTEPEITLPPVQIEKPDEPYWTPWTGSLRTPTTFRYGGPEYPLVKDPKDPDAPPQPLVKC